MAVLAIWIVYFGTGANEFFEKIGKTIYFNVNSLFMDTL